jgi:hypothetical protein
MNQFLIDKWVVFSLKALSKCSCLTCVEWVIDSPLPERVNHISSESHASVCFFDVDKPDDGVGLQRGHSYPTVAWLTFNMGENVEVCPLHKVVEPARSSVPDALLISAAAKHFTLGMTHSEGVTAEWHIVSCPMSELDTISK